MKHQPKKHVAQLVRVDDPISSLGQVARHVTVLLLPICKKGSDASMRLQLLKRKKTCRKNQKKK